VAKDLEAVAEALPAPEPAEAVAEAPAAAAGTEWFMDYRNSDGSVAEMCGNGVRVFARYLVDAGLVTPGELVVGTRSGPRSVLAPADGDVAVDMGPALVLGDSAARIGGELFAGLAVDLGNPHLACVTARSLDRLDLTRAPGYDRGMFPNGVKVGFGRPRGVEAVAVRVHERGVGETRSCGTGTVAAVVAALRATGRMEGGRDVHAPGGRLHVDVTASTTTLTGPAVLVARGELDAASFPHREHVRMALEMLRRHDFVTTVQRFSQALRLMSSKAGRPQAFWACWRAGIRPSVSRARRRAAPSCCRIPAGERGPHSGDLPRDFRRADPDGERSGAVRRPRGRAQHHAAGSDGDRRRRGGTGSSVVRRRSVSSVAWLADRCITLPARRVLRATAARARRSTIAMLRDGNPAPGNDKGGSSGDVDRMRIVAPGPDDVEHERQPMLDADAALAHRTRSADDLVNGLTLRSKRGKQRSGTHGRERLVHDRTDGAGHLIRTEMMPGKHTAQ